MSKFLLPFAMLAQCTYVFAQIAAFTSAQAVLKQGATVNMMVGVMLLSKCGDKSGEQQVGMLYCLMGAVELAQAMKMNNAANQTAQTTAAISTAPVMVPVATVSASTVTPLIPASSQIQVTNGLRTLSAAGYKVTSEGVTAPTGKFVSSDTVITHEGLSQLGFDSKLIESAQNLVQKVRSQAAQQQFSKDSAAPDSNRKPSGEE